jgi:DNA topoisomerase-1
MLWKPIRPGLSAGRVQTVALRLIVEREAEIRAFEAEEYWSVAALLEKDGARFDAKLHHIGGKAFRLADEDQARAVVEDVRGLPFEVGDLKRRERLKNPPAPFTTSTMQQEAAKRLGFTAQRTMRMAQQLYEGVDVGPEGAVGLITYMRTDSTRVGADAVNAARDLIGRSFGERYVASSPRLWTGKQQKGAQEAHEAIRPTDASRRPESLKGTLDRDQYRLYELIWLRFVAGQMAPAVYDTTTADFDIAGRSGSAYLFRATGSVVKFDGFTRLYQEAREEGDHRTLDDLAPLPRLEKGDACTLHDIIAEQHFTQPPPRFTEASLVKELERLGIGRPSTYAQIISTLADREYTSLEQKRFHPTSLGEVVANVLVRVFPDLFNVDFTSGMEAELDRIEEGEVDWRKALTDFYSPFQRQLADGATKTDAIVREVVAGETRPCPECGRELIVRWNKYGRFLGCSGYPECRHTEQLDGKEKAAPKPTGETCPNCGSATVEREGRFGAFIACSNYPQCKYTRPRTIPGLKCPQCGTGEIGEKRTRRGKPFWGCTRYPECDWSIWDEPVPQACETCDAPFLVKKKTKAKGEFLRCTKCSSVYAVPGAVATSAGDDEGTGRHQTRVRISAGGKRTEVSDARPAAATAGTATKEKGTRSRGARKKSTSRRK